MTKAILISYAHLVNVCMNNKRHDVYESFVSETAFSSILAPISADKVMEYFIGVLFSHHSFRVV